MLCCLCNQSRWQSDLPACLPAQVRSCKSYWQACSIYEWLRCSMVDLWPLLPLLDQISSPLFSSLSPSHCISTSPRILQLHGLISLCSSWSSPSPLRDCMFHVLIFNVSFATLTLACGIPVAYFLVQPWFPGWVYRPCLNGQHPSCMWNYF